MNIIVLAIVQITCILLKRSLVAWNTTGNYYPTLLCGVVLFSAFGFRALRLHCCVSQQVQFCCTALISSKGCDMLYTEPLSIQVQAKPRDRRKGDLSDQGMLVGARDVRLGFMQPPVAFTEHGLKYKNYPVCLKVKHLANTRHQRGTTRVVQDELGTIVWIWRCRWMCTRCLLSAKNRNLGLRFTLAPQNKTMWSCGRGRYWTAQNANMALWCHLTATAHVRIVADRVAVFWTSPWERIQSWMWWNKTKS